MSLGTTRFSAPTAAGSNAKKRHTAIFVLTVAAHPRSGSIIYPSPASRTANISSRAAFTWQRGRVQFTRAASSDPMVHCSRLTWCCAAGQHGCRRDATLTARRHQHTVSRHRVPPRRLDTTYTSTPLIEHSWLDASLLVITSMILPDFSVNVTR